MIAPADVTGLVLAGGRGSRMGGADKGLLPLHGVPLALHAARRLQPQVGRVAINANRHLDQHAAWGLPVWPDADTAGFLGPLAGILAGLRRCETPWLACVPCDSPAFPADLVARLAVGAEEAGVPLAVACAPHPAPDTGTSVDPVNTTASRTLRVQPVFCLLRAELAEPLATYLAGGGRKAGAWMAGLPHARVAFDRPGDDPAAFDNLNTPADWARVGAPGTRPEA